MLMKNIKKLKNLHINSYLCSIKNYPIHMHDAYEFIFVLEGSVNFKCTAFNYHLTKGDIFIVNVKELHSISETQEENLLLILQLDPYQYLNLFPKLDYYYFVCDSFSNKSKNNPELRNLQSTLANIMLLLQKQHSKDLIEELIIKLMHFLISDYQSFDIDQAGYHNKNVFKDDSIQTERILALQEYIYRNYTQRINIEELSQKLNLDKYYVSRLFKTATGLSISDFLCLCRVEYSEVLLLSTSMSIDQIALECGFSARRYYDKHFMKWFNMKPAEYRRNYLNSMNQISKEDSYYEINLNDALIKVKEFCSPEIQVKNLPNTKLHEIDFSCTTVNFQHTWEENICVSDVYNCLNFSESLILEAKKEIKFTNFKIGNVLENFLTNSNSPSNFEYVFFNFMDFLIESNFRPTILINPLYIEQSNIVHSIDKMLRSSVRKYGLDIIKNWSFELNKDLKIIGSTKKINFFIETINNVINQYSKSINIQLKSNLTKKEKYIYDTTYLVPYIIDKTLKPKEDTQEIYRELFDMSYDQNESLTPYSSCNGLFSTIGIKKPLYHAWHILSMLGDRIGKIEDGIIVTKRGDDFYVLVYDFKNVNLLDSSGSISSHRYIKKDDKPIKIVIRPLNIHHNYTITRFLLDSDNSLFKHLASMNFPKTISNEERNFITTASSPKISFSHISSDSTTDIRVDLNPFSAELLIFKRLY